MKIVVSMLGGIYSWGNFKELNFNLFRVLLPLNFVCIAEKIENMDWLQSQLFKYALIASPFGSELMGNGQYLS